MLTVKLIGAALVLLSGTAIGIYFSGKEAFRIQELQEMKKTLLILSSEIEFMSTPLPEAMVNIAGRSEPPVKQIFTKFSEGLACGSVPTAYRAWESAVNGIKKDSNMTEEDFEAILNFGKTLGYLDKQMQINAIAFTIRYIDDKTAALQSNCDKNKRMRRSLGAIGGALLAVMLW